MLVLPSSPTSQRAHALFLDPALEKPQFATAMGMLLAVPPTRALDAPASGPVLSHGDVHPPNALEDGVEELVLVELIVFGILPPASYVESCWSVLRGGVGDVSSRVGLRIPPGGRRNRSLGDLRRRGGVGLRVWRRG